MKSYDINRLFIIVLAYVFAVFYIMYRRVMSGDSARYAGGPQTGVTPLSGVPQTGGTPLSGVPQTRGTPQSGGSERDPDSSAVWKTRFYILAASALLIRLAFAGAIEGFPNDMACFKSWSEAASGSFITLYDDRPGWFIDYPPGYMYVLLVLGKIRDIFNIPKDSGAYTALIKLPAILSDIACGFIIYRLTGRRDDAANAREAKQPPAANAREVKQPPAVKAREVKQPPTAPALRESARLLIAACCFFNPAAFLISSVWGQIDSVLSLLVLLAILAYVGKRHAASGVFYALSVLFKPQGIIFLPVAFFILLYDFLKDKDYKPALKMIAGAAAAAFLTILPFTLRRGPLWIVRLYMNTLGGYQSASLNAFNFFALFGGNWVDDSNVFFAFSYKTWGVAAIIAFTVLTGVFVFKAKETRGISDGYILFMGSALLLFGVVTFGHRMHERYFFPTLPLLLAAAVMRSPAEGLKAERPFNTVSNGARAIKAFMGSANAHYLLYIIITISGYLNVLLVFATYYTRENESFYNSVWIYLISFVNVAASAGVLIAAYCAAGALKKAGTGKKTGPVKAARVLVSVIILVALSSVILYPQPAYAQPAMSESIGQPIGIQNPGFEESGADSETGFQGWDLYDYRGQRAGEPGTSVISMDTEVFHSGGASARIDSSATNDARFYQMVTVQPGSVYRISCWAKTDSVADTGVGANVSVLGVYAISSDIKGVSDGFRFLELFGITGPSQNELWISVGLGGYSNECYGTAWFDDVALELLDAAPPGITPQKFYDSNGEDGGSAAVRPNALSAGARVALLLIVASLLVLIAFIALRAKKRAVVQVGSPYAENPLYKLDRHDLPIISIMTAAYLALAFFRLGGLTAPGTFWRPARVTDSVLFEFEAPVRITGVIYNGNISKNSDSGDVFELYALDADGGQEILLTAINEMPFYEWISNKTDASGVTAVRLTTVTPGNALNEIAFIGTDANGISGTLPVKIVPDACSLSEYDEGSIFNLIDEQETVPERPDILNGTYFDEIYFARTAYENIHNLQIFETTHPPLGKLITALGILIFGMNPFGWRIMGMLAGAAMIPAMYAFAKKLFGKRQYAFFAAFLLTFDFMHFAQTRLSTIDSYVTLLIIIMYMFMLDSFMNGIEGRPLKDVLVPLGLSGLAFGLGVSVKWIALYAGAGLAFVFALSRVCEITDRPADVSRRRKRKNTGVIRGPAVKRRADSMKLQDYWPRFWVVIASCVLFFIVIPSVIYMLSYIPYYKEPGATGGIFRIVYDNQVSMFNYHGKLTDTHPFESIWWKWPLDITPIWYYSASGLPDTLKASVVSFGNPLIWWTGIPCLIAAFITAYRKADKRMALVFAAFLIQFAPWIFISRATFIYHYFSSTPFMIFAIVYVIKKLTESGTISSRAVYAYLAAAAVLFAVYYPVLSGLPVPVKYSNALKLFSTWIW